MRSLRSWGLTLAIVAALGGMGGFLIVRGLKSSEGLSPDSRPVHEWVAALSDPSPTVRREAAEALSRLGPKAVSALKPLLETLRDEDVLVRANVVVALSKLGPVAFRP